jgi:hypothetical protein
VENGEDITDGDALAQLDPAFGQVSGMEKGERAALTRPEDGGQANDRRGFGQASGDHAHRVRSRIRRWGGQFVVASLEAGPDHEKADREQREQPETQALIGRPVN